MDGKRKGIIMKKTNCFLKDGLKRTLQTACGLSLLLAASLFSGCATATPVAGCGGKGACYV
jgi:hypothetical protein